MKTNKPGFLFECTGSPWNAIDKQGKCAGEFAMDAGQEEATQILLEAGILLAMQSRKGRSIGIRSSQDL